MIKVLVIEDHPLMLQAVEEQLAAEADITVVGTSNRGSQVHQLVRKSKPDVVVLDLGMSNEVFEPVAAVSQLRQDHPYVEILVLTGYDDPLYMREITRAGARGYLLKTDDFSMDLPRAVRSIHAGQPYYSHAVVKRLLSDGSDPETFSEQELAVLRLLARGLVNEKIGGALGVSERRVRNILTGIYAKMGLQDEPGMNPRVAAIVRAREMGLLPEE